MEQGGPGRIHRSGHEESPAPKRHSLRTPGTRASQSREQCGLVHAVWSATESGAQAVLKGTSINSTADAQTRAERGFAPSCGRLADLMTKTRILLILVFVLSSSTIAQATTVERLNLDGLVKKSNRIVIGRVRNSRTYWS